MHSFLTISLPTSLFSLLISAGTVTSLFLSTLYVSTFKLAKSDSAARLDVPKLVPPFISDRSDSYSDFP